VWGAGAGAGRSGRTLKPGSGEPTGSVFHLKPPTASHPPVLHHPVQIDVDECASSAEEAGIRAVPTFRVFKDGALLREMSGANAAALQTVVSDLAA
jgi:hypothetical protein